MTSRSQYAKPAREDGVVGKAREGRPPGETVIKEAQAARQECGVVEKRAKAISTRETVVEKA